jgi:OmpA-OmpF porin, OOP family
MLKNTQALIALAAFAAAALLATGGAIWAVTAIEQRSTEAVSHALDQADLDWVEVGADGLQVHLTGTAPTEAARFQALATAGRIVDAARVIDGMQAADTDGIAPPAFLMEILRNEDGIQLVGLVPAAVDHDTVIEGIRALSPDLSVTDLLESADYDVPPGWFTAMAYGIEALKALPRSKISISADRVAITASSDSAEEKRRLEGELTRNLPEGIELALDISAPRPVITPFALRFLIDERGARFDACSADTDRGRDRILRAAVAAGASGQLTCTLGLGVPSPQWAEAAETGIAALAELGGGTLTFADADVTLIAAEGTDQALFDRVVGELDTALPEVFSLNAVLPEPPVENARPEGPVEFTATLAEDGQVQLRGRLEDDRMRDAVDSFARALFGVDAVYVATRPDPELPDGWPIRVLAALEGLGALDRGRALVRPDLVEITGTTGNAEASESVARLLSEKLGPGQQFRLNIDYDRDLDPVASLPTPQECVAAINAIVFEAQITFAPGSARIDAAARGTLDAIAAQLVQCPDVAMEVSGHTDSQGRLDTNLRLSQQRAEAVLDALRARRVLVGGLTAKGYGADEPIADNATAAGREANRRIEFKLILPEGTEDPAIDTATGAEASESEAPESPAVAVDESQITVTARTAGSDTPRPQRSPRAVVDTPAEAEAGVAAATADAPADSEAGETIVEPAASEVAPDNDAQTAPAVADTGAAEDDIAAAQEEITVTAAPAGPDTPRPTRRPSED